MSTSACARSSARLCAPARAAFASGPYPSSFQLRVVLLIGARKLSRPTEPPRPLARHPRAHRPRTPAAPRRADAGARTARTTHPGDTRSTRSRTTDPCPPARWLNARPSRGRLVGALATLVPATARARGTPHRAAPNARPRRAAVGLPGRASIPGLCTAAHARSPTTPASPTPRPPHDDDDGVLRDLHGRRIAPQLSSACHEFFSRLIRRRRGLSPGGGRPRHTEVIPIRDALARRVACRRVFAHAQFRALPGDSGVARARLAKAHVPRRMAPMEHPPTRRARRTPSGRGARSPTTRRRRSMRPTLSEGGVHHPACGGHAHGDFRSPATTHDGSCRYARRTRTFAVAVAPSLDGDGPPCAATLAEPRAHPRALHRGWR